MMDIGIDEHVIRNKIITLSGRIDAFSVPALREAQERMLAEGHSRFVVDLRQVTFMDSAGLSTLVTLLKRARQAGGNVVLVSPTDPAAMRILSLTRFDQVFYLSSDIDDAVKHL